MVVRQKPELRNIFRTGQVPTQQDFTDFIDSYIGSINGNMPSPDGNVEVAVNFTVMQQLSPTTLPYDFPEGRTVAIHDYVKGANDPWEAILPTEVESGEIFISTTRFDAQDITFQEIDTNRDGVFFSDVSRVANGNTWGPTNNHPFVRSINGVMTPFDGNVVIPETQKQASVFFRRESNQTILASADTTMIFNGKDNNPISVTVDVNTGVFTLNQTKKYSFDVNPTVQFVSGASNVDYSMFSYVDGAFTQITSQRGFISNDGSTGSGSSHTGSFVVDGSVYPQVAIRAVTIGGASETRGFGLLAIYSHVLIKEL